MLGSFETSQEDHRLSAFVNKLGLEMFASSLGMIALQKGLDRLEKRHESEIQELKMRTTAHEVFMSTVATHFIGYAEFRDRFVEYFRRDREMPYNEASIAKGNAGDPSR